MGGVDGCWGGEADEDEPCVGVRGVAVLGELDVGGSKKESPGASNSFDSGG